MCVCVCVCVMAMRRSYWTSATMLINNVYASIKPTSFQILKRYLSARARATKHSKDVGKTVLKRRNRTTGRFLWMAPRLT